MAADLGFHIVLAIAPDDASLGDVSVCQCPFAVTVADTSAAVLEHHFP